MQDEDGYFTPGSLTLPPDLAPEQRARALGIVRDMQMQMEQYIVEAEVPDDDTFDEAMTGLVGSLNKDPQRVREYAELTIGRPVTEALMIYDGRAEDGSAKFSFAVTLGESQPADPDPED